MEDKTILHYFFQNAKMGRGSVQFWGMEGIEKKYNYQNLLQGSLQVCAGLKECGISQGDVVAIVLPTCVEFYYAFFGAMLLGAIPCALYPPVRMGRLEEWEDRTQKMLEVGKVKIILSEDRILPFLTKISSLAGISQIPQTVQSLLRGKETNIDHELQKFPDLDEVAFIQFSSGSTGVPRGISITHGNLMANVSAIMSPLKESGIPMRGVSWLPLYHDMGLVGPLMGAIFSEGELLLIRPEHFIARPIFWFQAMTEFKATITVAPNFSYSLSLEKIEKKQLESINLKELKVMMSGAEPVHPQTMIDFIEKFRVCGLSEKSILPVYGLAEGTLAVSFRPLFSGLLYKKFNRAIIEKNFMEESLEVVEDPQGVSLASVGLPLNQVSIRIGDTMARDLGKNRVGKVWIAGPNVALEKYNYLSCHYQSGWLDTGDLGFLFDGELFICGREKDIIILRGRNIDPSPIEQFVGKENFIRSGCVAAFSVLDEKRGGERLVVVAELKESEKSAKELDDFKRLISNALNKEFQLGEGEIVLVKLGSLPRTSSGKIQRRRTRELYLSKSIDRGAGNGALKALKTILYGKLLKYLKFLFK